MAKAKTTLRDRCLAEAPKVGRDTWLDRLDPKLLKEVTELILEWHRGGEVRASYPTAHQLCTWLSDLESIPVSGQTMKRFAKDVIKRNGKP